MSEEIVSVDVELAGRTYKVNAKKSEKSVFEQASLMVNETIKGYEAKYAYKEKQDLLAIVLLQYVTALIRQNKSQMEHNDKALEKLKALLQDLERSI